MIDVTNIENGSSGKDCRIVVQKLNLMKEHENQENVSFNRNSNHDNYSNDNDNYTEQPKSNVNVENKWTKYLDKSEEIESNIFKASSSKDNSQIETDHLEYSEYCDNDTICKWPQNEHTNIDNDVSYENDFKQDLIYHNEQEHDNFVSEEIDNVSDSDNKSNDFHSKNVNEIKSTKNIFDDNEDFDITIDF
ncbi:hypothetical protein E2986_00516 [Frieseomelitta varia]|uniref:Uncharacterized protein n=1 Tax=Frieseomelitta varia TaxID=561572 RepID=A0A833RPA3_9HYME|nr:hypothetical protein E2986_00516 [Frieseomelitta varia]